eukprot:4159085-Pyramimonas_sp.AAC.1
MNPPLVAMNPPPVATNPTPVAMNSPPVAMNSPPVAMNAPLYLGAARFWERRARRAGSLGYLNGSVHGWFSSKAYTLSSHTIGSLQRYIPGDSLEESSKSSPPKDKNTLAISPSRSSGGTTHDCPF